MTNIHSLIKNRYSPRAFDSRMVEEEKILQLFEASRWAASSMNEQPWRFIYVTKNDELEYKAMFSVIVDWNQEWVKTAPVIILAVAKLNFSHNNKPNRHAWHDIGLAIGNMSLQATELGLYLHSMAGFSKSKAIEVLNIPEGYEPVTMIACGYKGNINQLSEEFQKLENNKRTRMEFEKIVFRNKWNS